jgi:hypothetical protein
MRYGYVIKTTEYCSHTIGGVELQRQSEIGTPAALN